VSEKVSVIAIWMRLIYEVLWLLGLAGLICAYIYAQWSGNRDAAWSAFGCGIVWFLVCPVGGSKT